MTGIGFETSEAQTYSAFFGQGGDLRDELFEKSTSVFLRLPFEINSLPSLHSLQLRMKFDDGFVAWINGKEIASGKAPNTRRWNEEATGIRSDELALVFQDFDVSSSVAVLNEGTNILAIQGLNAQAASSDLFMMPELHGVELGDPERGEIGFLDYPTPGRINAASFTGLVKDTMFNVDRGFFNEPFELEITTSTEGAEIRYTLNGNAPTSTTGIVYTQPFLIDRTTILRAAAFKQGLRPTNVDTVSYFFLDDVLNQAPEGTPPEGWPESQALNGQVFDYGMDPEVVDGIHTSEEVRNALLSIPSLSLVSDSAHLFGTSKGIYVNASNKGRQWERSASFGTFESRWKRRVSN